MTASLRGLVGLPFPPAEKFIWPVFIVPGKKMRQEIAAMPGQYRWSSDMLLPEIERVLRSGVRSILVFGVPEKSKKDAEGSFAHHPKNMVQLAVREMKKRFPELNIFTDVCVCSYTSHGHCAPVCGKSGDIDNDRGLETLAKIAVSHAEAGVDGVAPSAMLDGQVVAIRRSLESSGFKNTIIMSYSTKFASSLYFPFREAAGSAPEFGDRRSYQVPDNSLGQAVRESLGDEKEGADILMVKPALFYLDVIAKIKEATHLPVAAYNVSGEYSMIQALGKQGWGSIYPLAAEGIMAISRAGADTIISYWADRYEEVRKAV